MTIERIKTPTELRCRAEHNLREKNVPNADKDKEHLNDELVKMTDDTILDSWNRRFSELPNYEYGKLRKDAVRAFEIVMTVSKEDAAKIDLEKWKKDNVEWLKQTFDVSPDGKTNLLSVVYHGDESNAHIHAIVTPIDERGKFNAQNWIGGKSKLIELQNSYGKAMKKHGLKRGLEGSIAKHKDIKRFYAELDHNLNIDKDFSKGLNETPEQYQERIIDQVKNIKAAQLREISKKDRTIVELKTQLKQKKKEETLDEVVELRQQTKRLKTIQEKWEGIEREYGNPDIVNKKIETAQNLNKAMEIYPDVNVRDETLENIKKMLKWYEDEKEKEKQVQYQKELNKEI